MNTKSRQRGRCPNQSGARHAVHLVEPGWPLADPGSGDLR